MRAVRGAPAHAQVDELATGARARRYRRTSHRSTESPTRARDRTAIHESAAPSSARPAPLIGPPPVIVLPTSSAGPAPSAGYRPNAKHAAASASMGPTRPGP